jgi:nitrite reductase/ring-hydroxylating ferredoxin subunit
MADDARVICESSALDEGGKGVRFTVRTTDGELPAFAVRYSGKVYAYLNRCAHVPTRLDWDNDAFFDYSKLYLICATHGAMYLPHTGVCAMGPCRGKRLQSVAVEERDGQVVLLLKDAQYV